MNTPIFVWLIAFLLTASPLIYLLGRTRLVPARWVTWGVMFGAWLLFAQTARDGAARFALESIALNFDGVSLLVVAVTLALGSAVAIFSGAYMAGDRGEEKYYAMLVAMIGAILGLACAADLFNLWVWFEAMAISSYLLVAFYRDRAESLEAGVKYLVQSAAGSALILLGIALVLVETGTLDLHAMRGVTDSLAIRAALGLFVIGFGVKAALVPLHTWLPDAHAQAPSGISAMLSGIVIQAGLVAMLRALSPLVEGTNAIGILLIGFALLNIIVGNFLALRQIIVKRLLAFSSIAQMGYILLGIGIGIFANDTLGAQGGLFHLSNHALMKGLAFLAIGALLYAFHSQDALTIADLAGAAKRYPLVAFTLSIAVLGLGGLPPLAGFMSKWQILIAGLQAQNNWLTLAIIVAAMNSVLSLAYYAPLVNAVYRTQPSASVQNGIALPLAMHVPLAALALAIIVIGIYPSVMDGLTQPASIALMAAFGK